MSLTTLGLENGSIARHSQSLKNNFQTLHMEMQGRHFQNMQLA